MAGEPLSAEDQVEPLLESQTPAWLQATIPDLDGVDIDQPVTGADTADFHEVAELYGAAAAEAGEAHAHAAARVFSMLSAVFDMRLTSQNPGQPYEPMAVFPDGQRTAVPTDFRGHVPILAMMAERTGAALLRSRLADVSWLLDRRRRACALLAVSSYADVVEAIVAGKLRRRRQQGEDAGRLNFGGVRYLRRALQIARWLKGDDPEIRRARDLAIRLRKESLKALDGVTVRRLSALDIDFGLSDPAEVGRDFDSLLAVIAAKLDPDARVELWRAAARAYHSARREDDWRRCRAEAAEALVEIAAARNSPMVSAKFLADAISELHGLPGKRDRRKELQHRLIDVQAGVLDELSSFTHQMDLTEIVERTEGAFEDLDLTSMLFTFAALGSSPEPDKLVKEAQESIAAHPLASLFGATHLDHEGKVVHQTPDGGFGDDASDPAIIAQIAQSEGIRRTVQVRGSIEPARQIVVSRHLVTDDLLEMVAKHSPFVDPRQEELFAKGLAAFFCGDRVGAIHILVPLLESSLRYVLKSAGLDVSTFDAATQTQQDRTISALFADMRNDLVGIFGAAFVHDIDFVFLRRPGPALRHSVAHGLLGDGAPYSDDAIYACWLMFRLTMISLFDHQAELRQALLNVGHIEV